MSKTLLNSLLMQVRELNKRVTRLEQQLHKQGQRIAIKKISDGTSGSINIDRFDLLTDQYVTLVTVPENYLNDGKHLLVFVNGRLMVPNVDYLELDDKHIEFQYKVSPGTFISLILFK